MSLIDGGPAFPCHTYNDSDRNSTDQFGTSLPPGWKFGYPGMTLRDSFAAAALKGELASQEGADGGNGYWSDKEPYVSNLAARCYRIADAMLKARDA